MPRAVHQTSAGLGLDLALRPGLGVTVTNVHRGGGAARAGAPRVGDVITRVNRQPVDGLALPEIAAVLRDATVVRLTFVRKEQLR